MCLAQPVDIWYVPRVTTNSICIYRSCRVSVRCNRCDTHNFQNWTFLSIFGKLYYGMSLCVAFRIFYSIIFPLGADARPNHFKSNYSLGRSKTSKLPSLAVRQYTLNHISWCTIFALISTTCHTYWVPSVCKIYYLCAIIDKHLL